MHAVPEPLSIDLPTQLLIPPAWVDRLTGLSLQQGAVCNADFCRVAVRIENAISLNPVQLCRQTQSAYAKIFRALAQGHGYHPVRFWNFLPGIHDIVDSPQNRYMVFNSGRYQAFEKQFGSADQFDGNVATASAVGYSGDVDASDLWIHCLANRRCGKHFGNPRQVSPHRYSSRFGIKPPCFARATLLFDQSLLLIGGTASICGEESLHHDLAAQTQETLFNISQLISSSIAAPVDPLAALTELRVYCPSGVDQTWLQNMLSNRLPNLEDLTLVTANLCRAELLVEIEGIARVPRTHESEPT